MNGEEICPLTSGKRVLVAYFSWSGSTEKVARLIAGLTGGSLLEVATVKSYPTDMTDCVAEALKEFDENARPELATPTVDMSQWDVVFVGFPNWHGTAPMAMWTFLDDCKFSGQLVIPFITHGRGGRQHCFEDIALHVQGALVLEGFSWPNAQMNEYAPATERWLRELKPVQPVD